MDIELGDILYGFWPLILAILSILLRAFWWVILIILSALLGAHSLDESEEKRKNKLRERLQRLPP